MTDLSQFHDVFFEESRELLDSMEAALLEIGSEGLNDELINSVFRTAHSIKGGASTFGFKEIAEFTHSVEFLLDEMRNGRIEADEKGIDLLLRTVDVVCGMLEQQRAGEDIDTQISADMQFDLEMYMHEKDAGGKAPEKKTAEAQPAVVTEANDDSAEDDRPEAAARWNVRFEPHGGVLRKGNAPLRMFEALARHGTLETTARRERLPGLDAVDPEMSCLAWDFALDGNVARDDIDEVFEWVESDSELTVECEGCARGNEATAEPAPPVANDIPSKPGPDAIEGARPDARLKLAAPAATTGHESGSIRVNIEKIDDMINLVGELVITQSMLNQFGGNAAAGSGCEVRIPANEYEKLRTGLAQLERNTRELQDNVMRIRMLPINFVFQRFPRMVRDLSRKLEKQIELKLSGETTELDKTVLEKLGDPLVHLVRNAVDHGLEPAAERVASGKEEKGTLRLGAYHLGGNIIVEVSDDGRGLDREKLLAKARDRDIVSPGEDLPEDQVLDLIFAPGFSTAAETTDVSGRGVGMDVVRRNVRELGGNIEVRTRQGEGTTFRITLPLTLAIMDGQSLRVDGEQYILPLTAIIESVQVNDGTIKTVAGKGEMVNFRDEYLPVIRLGAQFSTHGEGRNGQLLVIVEGDNRKVGLLVDELLCQQQVVIKSLETNYRRMHGISGATILGDGSVALILDVPGLIRMTTTSEAA